MNKHLLTDRRMSSEALLGEGGVGAKLECVWNGIVLPLMFSCP